MSLKTDNFKLYKYEDNDIGDLRFINDSMDTIDKGINPFYVATQSSTNVYKVTTGLNKTVLNDGYSIKVAIPSNSNGAVSLVIDSCSAVAVKKPNGNVVTNFKQNGVYSLTYYNSVFILASGGVDDVNFSASDLLTGKSANDSNGEKVNGTMPNKGAVTATLNCGGSYTIPAGYHNGSGKVTANSLSSQTSANATAKDIIKGKTAWVNGSKLTGTATIQSLGGLQVKNGTATPTIPANSSTFKVMASSLGFKPKAVIITWNENNSDAAQNRYGQAVFAPGFETELYDGINGVKYFCDYALATAHAKGTSSYDKFDGTINNSVSNGGFTVNCYTSYKKSYDITVACCWVAIG